MIRKLLLGISCLIVTTQVFAKAYVGFDLGVRSNTTNVSNSRSGEGDVFIGYGTSYSQSFFFAGEILAGSRLIVLSNNSSPGQSISTKYTYGASILPGAVISDHALGYLRLGMASTRFASQNGTVFGGQIGIGFQTMLSDCWDMRAEYDYTRYETVNSNSSHANSDEFKLGFVYKLE